MARFRVLYTDRGDYSHGFSIEQPLYDAIGAEIIDARLDHNALDWPTYERHLAEADALICFRVAVDRRAVEAAPRLKVAVRSGVGYENFDLAAFAERGIPACNVPDYGSEEVAVHALALMLALRRRVVYFDHAVRQGVWRVSGTWIVIASDSRSSCSRSTCRAPAAAKSSGEMYGSQAST